MKKILSLVATLALTTFSAFAQWSLPEVKGSDLVSCDTCYLYNKEAGAFLRGIGSGSPYWGTRAGVTLDGVAYVMKPAVVESVKAGTEASNNYEIPWQAPWDNETYIISGNDNEIWFDIMDFSTIWVDRQHDVNANVNFFWNFEKNANGTYYISCSKKSTFLGDPNLYESLVYRDETTGEITSAPALVGGEKLGIDIADPDLVAHFEGYDNGKYLAYEWVVVAKADYEAIDFDGFSRYYEALSLKELINESKAAYPDADFSAAEAIYNNTASSLEELQNAKELVKKAILDYEKNAASPSNPRDMTFAITNPSFDVQGDFTGWKGTGFNAGGNASTCAELWNYSAFDTYQDLVDLPAGIYKLGAKGFYRAGGSTMDWETKDDPTYRHAKMYAFSGEDSLYTPVPSLSSTAAPSPLGQNDEKVGDGSETCYVSGSMYDFTQYKNAGYIKEMNILMPIENGNMRIGVVKNSYISNDWFIVDDFTLIYYGNSNEAYDLWKDEILAAVPTADEIIGDNEYYNKAYETALEEAVAAVQNATDKAAIKTAIKAVDPAVEALQNNIAAYKVYLAKAAEVEAYFDEHDDLEGEAVSYIVDYFVDASAPGNTYPNGGHVYIKENGHLTTEQIVEETENIEAWFQKAVKEGMRAGSDVSHLLVNPSFADGFTGWVKNTGSVGGKKDICPNVEIYENSVEVYQIVKDVPAGIYSISAQGFERPSNPGSITGNETPKVFLFMNEYQAPVMLVTDDVAPYETAQDRVNSYFIDSSTGQPISTSTDKWPYDYGYDGYPVQGWMPHSMDGASYAFAGGRYVNKCYGIVNEDGVMKIGLTSNGDRVHWVIWANFTLTYEGENAEALEAILETTVQTANDFIESHDAEMNSYAVSQLEEAIKSAEDALGSDYATMKVALDCLIAAIDAAREHVTLYARLLDAQFNMDETAAIYYEIASDEAMEAYNEISMKVTDLDNLTNEQIIELIKECQYVTAALKLPSDLYADDENPLELTSLIVNPDFSMGNASGWTYHIDPISNLGYQGNTHTNGDVSVSQFIEGWRSEGYMGDGTIEQTLSALPEGVYVLGADIIANNQKTGSAADTKGLYLFASEDGGKKTSIEVATDDWKPEHFELVFKKELKTSTITIGVEAINAVANWIAADNFTLTYYGTNSALDPNGIESVEAAEVVSSSYYTLGGNMTSVPVKGINIVKSVLSDGSVRVYKILVK